MEWGGTSASSYTTDVYGRTGAATVGSGDLIIVTIGEARTPLGSTLGQVVLFEDHTTSSDGGDTRGLIRFVPEARTVQFKAISDNQASGYITEDPHSESWYAHPFSSNPSYSFDAGVALLRGPDVIDAYFAYHQSGSPGTFLHGLVLRNESNVELTGDAMMLAIGREDHQYSNPSAAVVHVSTSGGGTCIATVLGFDDSFVYVVLEGFMPKGDTLILISVSGGPGGTINDPLQPSPIPSGGGGGGDGGGALGLGGSPSAVVHGASDVHCILAINMEPNPVPFARSGRTEAEGFEPCPPPPPSDVYCEVGVAPEPESDCAAEPINTGLSESRADIKPAWVGIPPCNDDGITSDKQVCWEIGGGVEFGFEVGDVIEVNVNGRISRVQCTSISVAPCFCTGTWFCDWFVKQAWQTCREYRVWIEWFTFETRTHWSIKYTENAGIEAISLVTTCPVTTGNCAPEEGE